MSTATLPVSARASSPQSPTQALRSAVIIVAGATLLLPGFLGSLMLLMLDLSGAALEDGTRLTSPLGDLLQNPQLLWLAFAVGTLMLASGLILIGSQPFCVPAAVAYVMCPIVSIAYMLGSPLRGDQPWNRNAAYVYAVMGILAAFAGAALMMYGPTEQEFPIQFVGAGFMFQLGIAAVLGAILRLTKRPSPA
jgi:hypothetical protein